MKQFFKQLAIGAALIAAFAGMVFILYWVAVFIVWLTGLIDFKLLVENWPWIVVGVIITIIVEILGIFGYWILNRIFGRGESSSKAKKSKKASKWDDEDDDEA